MQSFSREEAILKVEKLVYKLAHSYKGPSSWEDLKQAGMQGVMHAYDTFDETRGVRFITHAFYQIMKEMMSLNKSNYTIIPLTSYSSITSATSDDFTINSIMNNEAHGTVTMSSAITETFDIKEAAESECMSKLHNDFIPLLDDRERHIINKRYFDFENGKRAKLKDLSKETGLSIPMCSIIEKKALRKLKNSITQDESFMESVSVSYGFDIVED
jgi:RNA polymerase sigma factor (sigma-70 family)